jgi:hypothetical protein
MAILLFIVDDLKTPTLLIYLVYAASKASIPYNLRAGGVTARRLIYETGSWT